MARKNVHGVCPLCLKRGKLCKSHYLGRVLHTLSFTGKEPPIVMTPKLVKATSRQVWAHLLCGSCEQLLNKRGEKPVQALFNGEANNFRLLNLMGVALPLKVTSGFKISVGGLVCPDVDGTLAKSFVTYSGEAMGVDTEAMAYYALSILWKGSSHKWKTLDGQDSTVELGNYQEPVRRYLHGEGSFPDGVYVIATICTDKGSQGMTFAPSLVAQSRYTMYSILVRGIWFHVITTDKNPEGLSEICCYRSPKKVLFKEDRTESFLEAGRHIHKTATVRA